MDNVNHPSHYNQNGVETIDLIRYILTPEQFQGFLVGNVIKYLERHEFKNGQEDLDKAKWYAERAVQEDEYWAMRHFDEYWMMCRLIDSLLSSDFELAIEDLKEWREDVEEAGHEGIK